MRGLLAEYGIVTAQGVAALRRTVAELYAEGTTDASQVLREILHEMIGQLDGFEERLKAYDHPIGATRKLGLRGACCLRRWPIRNFF